MMAAGAANAGMRPVLIHQRLDLHRADDVANELRMDICLTNALVQQLPHRALELGRDLLRLVAHLSVSALVSDN